MGRWRVYVLENVNEWEQSFAHQTKGNPGEGAEAFGTRDLMNRLVMSPISLWTVHRNQSRRNSRIPVTIKQNSCALEIARNKTSRVKISRLK
jgi:hypothetical protein